MRNDSMDRQIIAAAAVLAVGLSACSKHDTQPKPQGSEVAADMPDTSAPRAPDATMTAPDAGATGTVPANGAPPPVAPTPPVGTAGGQNTPAPSEPPPK
jgi:hypothetical protein